MCRGTSLPELGVLLCLCAGVGMPSHSISAGDSLGEAAGIGSLGVQSVFVGRVSTEWNFGKHSKADGWLQLLVVGRHPLLRLCLP